MIDLPNITTITLPGSFNELRGYTVIQSPGFEEFFNIVPTMIPTPTPTPTPSSTQEPTNSTLLVETEEDCGLLSLPIWREIYVNSGLCNSYTDDMSISNNPYLETMYFSFNSSKNFHSLTVSNNSRLRTITTEHGKGGIFYCNYNLGTFINVPTVTFSSISFSFLFTFDLPNLTSFNFGNCSLVYTTTLVLSSSIILFVLIL